MKYGVTDITDTQFARTENPLHAVNARTSSLLLSPSDVQTFSFRRKSSGTPLGFAVSSTSSLNTRVRDKNG